MGTTILADRHCVNICLDEFDFPDVANARADGDEIIEAINGSGEGFRARWSANHLYCDRPCGDLKCSAPAIFVFW